MQGWKTRYKQSQEQGGELAVQGKLSLEEEEAAGTEQGEGCGHSVIN